MEYTSETPRKNPSRETCENIIRRILMTEILEKGKNEHFRSASDFMRYFESLYPASDALTKQVQRAIKAMDMPKDDNGYFIPNKTTEQLSLEKELCGLLKKADACVYTLENYTPVFLKAAPETTAYLTHLLESSPAFAGKFLTIVPASNGLILYTDKPGPLTVLLNSLIV